MKPKTGLGRSATNLMAASAISVGSIALSRLQKAVGQSTVHSVYDGAVNISTSEGLVSLVPDVAGRGPISITVRQSSFPSPGEITTGDRVNARGRTLTVGANLHVALDGATLYSTPRFPVPLSSDDDKIVRNLLAVREELIYSGRLSGLAPLVFGLGVGSFSGAVFPNLYCRSAAPALHKLVLALESDEEDLVEKSSSELIGLGPGLTPSGDDLIVGLLASFKGLRYAGHSLLSDVVKRTAPGNTTRVSWEYLALAAGGEFSEVVATLVGTMITGSERMAARRARDLASWGASSGADITAGVVIGGSVALGLAGGGHL